MDIFAPIARTKRPRKRFSKGKSTRPIKKIKQPAAPKKDQQQSAKSFDPGQPHHELGLKSPKLACLPQAGQTGRSDCLEEHRNTAVKSRLKAASPAPDDPNKSTMLMPMLTNLPLMPVLGANGVGVQGQVHSVKPVVAARPGLSGPKPSARAQPLPANTKTRTPTRLEREKEEKSLATKPHKPCCQPEVGLSKQSESTQQPPQVVDAQPLFLGKGERLLPQETLSPPVEKCIVARIHTMATGVHFKQNRNPLQVTISTELPESASHLSWEQKFHNAWSPDSREHLRAVTPKADGVTILLYWKRRSVNLATYGFISKGPVDSSAVTEFGGLFMCEPRKPPVRKLVPLQSVVLNAAFEALGVDEALLVGELVPVRGLASLQHIVLFDVVWWLSRGSRAHPHLLSFEKFKRSAILCKIVRKLDGLLQDIVAQEFDKRKEELEAKQESPSFARKYALLCTTYLSFKPLVFSVARLEEMFAATRMETTGETPSEFMHRKLVVNDDSTSELVPPVWFSHRDLKFDIPIDGFILLNMQCTGTHGRGVPVHRLSRVDQPRLQQSNHGVRVYPSIKFRFFSGADLWLILNKQVARSADETIVDAFDLTYFNSSTRSPLNEAYASIRSPVIRNADISSFGNKFPILRFIQTWKLGNSAVELQIKELLCANPDQSLVVEHVMTANGLWVPTKLRLDKERCNSSSTVDFARNSTMLLKGNPNRTMFLILADALKQ